MFKTTEFGRKPSPQAFTNLGTIPYPYSHFEQTEGAANPKKNTVFLFESNSLIAVSFTP